MRYLKDFEKLIIPKQEYAKFTTKPAHMPDVIVNAWQGIWKMTPEKLGGKRSYQTDFEIYDERASDHQIGRSQKSRSLAPCWGHVEVDEHPKDTVRRELFEELSLQADFAGNVISGVYRQW
jgi:hypothetical protein